jgi:hypothetical protein
MIREIYRSLLNTGRTYAAFRDDDRALFSSFAGKGPVLDPMSGYGRTTDFCAAIGMSSVTVETNPPQYLWQLLRMPQTAAAFTEFAMQVKGCRKKWPRTRATAVASDEYFPTLCLDLIVRLYECLSLPSAGLSDLHRLALIVPFVGRLSCCSPGDNSTHVKRGGICVLKDWQIDFAQYISSVIAMTNEISQRQQGDSHELIFGDARNAAFGRKRFPFMVSSPPYPNFRDFASMFEPENEFLSRFAERTKLTVPQPNPDIIGSNFVSGKARLMPESTIAIRFINAMCGSAGSRRVRYDDETYYVPYFTRYFMLLEEAYKNVSRYVAKVFRGYIVVVNNTHRGRIIPVAEFVREVWESLGFQTSLSRTIEQSHVGSKNPRARGVRAKHMEYVIEITRNE